MRTRDQAVCLGAGWGSVTCVLALLSVDLPACRDRTFVQARLPGNQRNRLTELTPHRWFDKLRRAQFGIDRSADRL